MIQIRFFNAVYTVRIDIINFSLSVYTVQSSDLSENFLNMINRIFEETDITVKFKNLELEAI